MRRHWIFLLLSTVLAVCFTACSHLEGNHAQGPRIVANVNTNANTIAKANSDPEPDSDSARIPHAAIEALESVRAKNVPDHHLAIFNVGLERQGSALVLTGDVERAEFRAQVLEAIAKTGVKVEDEVQVLSPADFGDQSWGLACLSVASGREKPGHGSEMGTQVLLGHPLQLWKRAGMWCLARCSDGYFAWFERGTFVTCTGQELAVWTNAPLLIVTAYEDRVLEKPQADAQPVSDVVMGGLLKRTGEEGDWFKVELPDQRAGFLPRSAAQDYRAWQQSRQPTAENIERTARTFLGRPYLWGGNSPKGMDCSGFTKLTFFLNGIPLNRNASEQAWQGTEVPLDRDLSQLKKGDLLFFGAPPRFGRPEHISHVGIYLGDKQFIQSSERVRISSLDPDGPNPDFRRIRTLIHARRVLSGGH